MIGPGSITELSQLITGGVNLFKYRFDSVEVSPGLASFATRAYYQSARRWNLYHRLQLMWLQAGHDIAVKQRTQKQEDDAFSFNLAPLSGSEGNDLKAIALTIFHTVSFIAGGPRMGLRFLGKVRLAWASSSMGTLQTILPKSAPWRSSFSAAVLPWFRKRTKWMCGRPDQNSPTEGGGTCPQTSPRPPTSPGFALGTRLAASSSAAKKAFSFWLLWSARNAAKTKTPPPRMPIRKTASPGFTGSGCLRVRQIIS